MFLALVRDLMNRKVRLVTQRRRMIRRSVIYDFCSQTEVLEERCLLSCTATIEQTSNPDAGAMVQTLVVTGDDQANDIEIQDEAGAGVTAKCDGQTLIEGALADRVEINSLGGSDTINYQLTSGPNSPTDAPIHRQIAIDSGAGDDLVTIQHSAGSFFDLFADVNLGDGDDEFDAAYSGVTDVNAPSPAGMRTLQLQVQGGAGADTLRVTVGSSDQVPAGTQLPAVQSSLGIHFDGGLAADRFFGVFQNVALNGPVSLQMLAGDGEGGDQFHTEFRNVAVHAAVSLSEAGVNGHDTFQDSFFDVSLGTGASLTVNQQGGNGEDTINNNIERLTVSDGAQLKWTANGGNATDDVRISIVDSSFDDSAWSMDIHLMGGNGPDHLTAVLQKVRQATQQTAGSLQLLLEGGNGPDNMSVRVEESSLNPAVMHLTVDGGLGPDTCSHTDDVTDVNCENQQHGKFSAPRNARGVNDDFLAAVTSLLASIASPVGLVNLPTPAQRPTLPVGGGKPSGELGPSRVSEPVPVTPPTFANAPAELIGGVPVVPAALNFPLNGVPIVINPAIAFVPAELISPNALPGLVANEPTIQLRGPSGVTPENRAVPEITPSQPASPGGSGEIVVNFGADVATLPTIAPATRTFIPTINFAGPTSSAIEVADEFHSGRVVIESLRQPLATKLTLPSDIFQSEASGAGYAWRYWTAGAIVVGSGCAWLALHRRRVKRTAALVDQVFAESRGDDIWPSAS